MNKARCSASVCTILALAAFFLPAALLGQDASTSRTYPAELIDALYGIEEGQIVVGALPATGVEDFPLLPGLEIIGSRTGENVVSVIAETTRSADDVGRAYADLLAERGWLRKEQRGPDRGFVPSGIRAYDWYCDAANVFFKHTIEKIGSGKTGLWLYRSVGASDQCLDRPDPARRRERRRDAPYPRMEAPADTRLKITGASESENSVVYTAALLGGMSAEATASHFGQQIIAEGWQSQGRCQQGPTHFETVTLMDSDEQAWIGVLSVVDPSSPSGVIQVSFEVVREGADEPYP